MLAAPFHLRARLHATNANRTQPVAFDQGLAHVHAQYMAMASA